MATKNLGRIVGLSAYEVWLEQGNTGTEEDFFNSLKGINGNDYVLTEADKEDISKLVEVNIPTKVSQLTNDKNYLTEHQDISNLATKTEVNAKASITDMTNYIEEHKDELKGADGKDGTNGTNGIDGKDGIDGYTPVKGTDYWTEEDKTEIVDALKNTVPLVKNAEQPEFVDSVDKMTDTSKVYVNDDGYLYAYMKGISSRRFTVDDFRYSEVNSDGSLTGAGYTRIPTVELVDLSVGTVSVYCPEPYQYFIYYYTDNDTSTYIGKTSWKSGNIEDVLTDVIASGTINGAKYCRISFRDGTSANANLNGRMDEFMENIIVTQTSNTEVYEWKNTGFSYNQPADYEDRIVALEQALEGIEYGSY